MVVGNASFTGRGVPRCLLDLVLIGGVEVKPIIWPLGYMITSSWAEVGVVQATSMQTQSKEGTVLTPACLRMRFL